MRCPEASGSICCTPEDSIIVGAGQRVNCLGSDPTGVIPVDCIQSSKNTTRDRSSIERILRRSSDSSSKGKSWFRGASRSGPLFGGCCRICQCIRTPFSDYAAYRYSNPLVDSSMTVIV